MAYVQCKEGGKLQQWCLDSLDTQDPSQKGCTSLLALDGKMRQRALKNSFIFNDQWCW